VLFWENMLLLLDMYLRHDLNKVKVIQNKNCLQVVFFFGISAEGFD